MWKSSESSDSPPAKAQIIVVVAEVHASEPIASHKVLSDDNHQDLSIIRSSKDQRESIVEEESQSTSSTTRDKSQDLFASSTEHEESVVSDDDGEHDDTTTSSTEYECDNPCFSKPNRYRLEYISKYKHLAFINSNLPFTSNQAEAKFYQLSGRQNLKVEKTLRQLFKDAIIEADVEKALLQSYSTCRYE